MKIDELALFGGTPAFTENLYVGRPNIGAREKFLELVNELLDRRWLSNNGPYVQRLEAEIAERLGVKHCIVMCNGTIALEIAIRALGLTGEVIVPSFTFIATAHALQWQQITPIFGDIDPITHTLNPWRVEAMITPRTTGIIGVHLWGQPCEIDILERIAEQHDLKLIFDASHAFGCSYRGQAIGNFGDLEVFSFHATKFVNTFEGGAVVTNNDELAEKIRLMKNFGFAGYDNVVYIGTNGKMSEVSAAMGLASLEKLDEFIATNQRNYRTYQQELANVAGVSLYTYDETETCNYQYIVLEVEESITRISRDRILKILHEENIIARRYFYPGCHRMEPYRSYFPHAGLLLPETEKIASKVLIMPTGTAVDRPMIQKICQIIRTVVDQGQEISDRIDSPLLSVPQKPA
ncbi:DegT/DnrJ/EryC1/StrS family aminotransferase [Microcystis aeruginosa CS-564/01]|uniref:DegT/DnrJ/EryC1/StrS family aminotransferase n=1 Tax=Microcystis aeruginosa TaxID=1126 RepID=UPI00232E20F0|nr:DegT/DnrJ/EryC1/StrS family aminotransferase [Microcystis aeruginosa]MDB9424883.1 DegT/DnrJ/EryC1/StrS family aminotransferase [Microcystis aeruginosa CS-564/01]